MTEKYLGDGAYVSYDGYGITVRAPRENGDHYVYFEPEVFEALLRAVDEWQKANTPESS